MFKELQAEDFDLEAGTVAIDGKRYTLRGPMATPYAIIEGRELKVCARYYTFHSDPEKHRQAFEQSLRWELDTFYPGGTVVEGDVAILLWWAVKGYSLNGDAGPEDASPVAAVAARRMIRALSESGVSDAILAQGALDRWGPVIRPWVWTTKLTPEGRVIWDCPEYEVPLDGLLEAEERGP